MRKALTAQQSRWTLSLALVVAALMSALTSVQAQDCPPHGLVTQITDTVPWRWGVFGGLQWNIVGTGAQQVEGVGTEFNIPTISGKTDIIDGTGLGYYAGAMAEYNPGTLFGFQLRAGLDDRRVEFNNWDVVDPTLEQRFSARVTYVSVEPLLRLNIIKPNFHLVVGPLLSFKVNSKFDYIPGRDQTSASLLDQEIPNMNGFTYGVSGGLGMDILMNSKSEGGTRWFLTPFAEASYMMAQRTNTVNPSSDRNDTWVTTSIRGGFQLKWGSARINMLDTCAGNPNCQPFSISVNVTPPSVVSQQVKFKEDYPLLPNIFFDAATTSLPTRYMQLEPSTAASFTESNVLNSVTQGSQSATERTQRQMRVYYNTVNILASRMRDNPSTTVTLYGSAPSAADGLQIANAVKNYMVSAFNINGSRIGTKGVTKPVHASGTARTPKEDWDKVKQENMRVEFISTDSLQLMKPVEATGANAAPNNDIVFNVQTSHPWLRMDHYHIAITGNGYSRTSDEYATTPQRIDATPIIGNLPSGTYTATVTATSSQYGCSATASKTFTLTKAAELSTTTEKRHSILFHYNDATTEATYRDFLTKTVAPQVSNGDRVVIRGYTDVVGTTEYNQKLSESRANTAVSVLKPLVGPNVTFDVQGLGETQSPFENGSPEGRNFNRTVWIEILPGTR